MFTSQTVYYPLRGFLLHCCFTPPRHTGRLLPQGQFYPASTSQLNRETLNNCAHTQTNKHASSPLFHLQKFLQIVALFILNVTSSSSDSVQSDWMQISVPFFFPLFSLRHFDVSAVLQCLIKGPAVFQQAHEKYSSSKKKN